MAVLYFYNILGADLPALDVELYDTLYSVVSTAGEVAVDLWRPTASAPTGCSRIHAGFCFQHGRQKHQKQKHLLLSLSVHTLANCRIAYPGAHDLHH